MRRAPVLVTSTVLPLAAVRMSPGRRPWPAIMFSHAATMKLTCRDAHPHTFSKSGMVTMAPSCHCLASGSEACVTVIDGVDCAHLGSHAL